MVWRDELPELSQEWVTAPISTELDGQESPVLQATVNTLVIKDANEQATWRAQYKPQPKQNPPGLHRLKLQQIFEPLPNASLMSDITEESEQDTEQSGLEKSKQQSLPDFTFACPPEKNSWRAMPHFLGQSQLDPQGLEEASPMHSTPPHSSPLITQQQQAHSSQHGVQEESVSMVETPSKPPVSLSDQTPRPVKLFQFNYDTFTRDHLASLVQEIDDRAFPSQHYNHPEGRWDVEDIQEESFVEGEFEERPSFRSAKRIRLSPETDFHDYKVPLPVSTPRSAVRDRIRERRRAFTSIAANGTPFRPSQQTSFSLPFKKTPMPSRIAEDEEEEEENNSFESRTEDEQQVQQEQQTLESLQQAEVEISNANPVTSRLQRAQALMDRIRAQPTEKSVSSYDDSGNSSTDNEVLSQPSKENRTSTTPFESDDDAPFVQTSMPRMGSHSPMRQRLSSRSAYASDRSSAKGTVKGVPSEQEEGTIKINTASTARKGSTGPTVASLFPDTQELKQSSLESKSSSTSSLAQQKLAMMAEASLRKSLSQSQDGQSTSHIPPRLKTSLTAQNHKTSASAASATRAPPTKDDAKKESILDSKRKLTTINPDQVEYILAQQQTASRMKFDAEQGRWIKLPKSQSSANLPDADFVEPQVDLDPNLDEGSSEDDVFAGIESFVAPSQVLGDQSRDEEFFSQKVDEEDDEPHLKAPPLHPDNISPKSSTDALEDVNPLQLYTAAHARTPGINLVTDDPGNANVRAQKLLPEELHDTPDFVPSPPVASTSSAQLNPNKFRRPSQADLLATPDVFGHKPLNRKNSKTSLEPVRPRSALKSRRSSSEQLEKSRSVSVSFSDGKKSGRLIQEAEATAPRLARGSSALRYELLAPVSFVDEEEDQRDDQLQSPSRGSLSVTELLVAESEISQRTNNIQQTVKDLVVSPSPLRLSLKGGNRLSMSQRSLGNATLMTECSFAVSHDALVKHLTDVEPFTPNWELLQSINLSGKGIDSLVRLKEFMPRLDTADLSSNNIEYLTGMSATVRTLLLQHNRLTSLTSFSHLLNLERLDLSSNNLDDLTQLGCLRHLRELKADNNAIATLNGLANLDSLLKLSLKNNLVADIDLEQYRWQNLEYLNLSKNKLRRISGVDNLTSCISLNLDHNELDELQATRQLKTLRILRLCSNPIANFDAKAFPALRTLFIDEARLGSLRSLGRLDKLENLSLRSQDGKLTLQSSSIAEVRRLYLSYNPLRTFPTQCVYINLTYLELVSCSLSCILPDSFSATVPSLQVLNLASNFLEDIQGLTGLKHLMRLKLMANRIESVESVVRCVGQLPCLLSLDLRLNPLSLSYYSTNVQCSSEDWLFIDQDHKRTLPDAWFFKRISYRAVLKKACPSLKLIDGLQVEGKEEREQIWTLLAKVDQDAL